MSEHETSPDNGYEARLGGDFESTARELVSALNAKDYLESHSYPVPDELETDIQANADWIEYLQSRAYNDEKRLKHEDSVTKAYEDMSYFELKREARQAVQEDDQTKLGNLKPLMFEMLETKKAKGKLSGDEMNDELQRIFLDPKRTQERPAGGSGIEGDNTNQEPDELLVDPKDSTQEAKKGKHQSGEASGSPKTEGRYSEGTVVSEQDGITRLREHLDSTDQVEVPQTESTGDVMPESTFETQNPLGGLTGWDRVRYYASNPRQAFENFKTRVQNARYNILPSVSSAFERIMAPENKDKRVFTYITIGALATTLFVLDKKAGTNTSGFATETLSEATEQLTNVDSAVQTGAENLTSAPVPRI